MPHHEIPRSATVAGKVSCAIVIALIVATLLYVGATAITQYGNIGV